MRVLIATPWFPSPGHSGSGIFNLRDAQLLARCDEVRVLHLIRPDWVAEAESEAEVEGIPVTRVPFSAGDPRTWPAARRAIRDALRDAELLHTMAFPALLPFAGLRVRQPWVHTEHWSGVGDAATGAMGLAGRALRSRLGAPDEVVAVSEALAAAIAPRARRTPHVIGNAVPFPVDGRISRPVTAGAPLRLVAVGGIAAHKGPLLAVETVAELVRRGVDVELRWIGEGAQRAEVEARVAALSLGARVRLLGQLERAELEEELLGANVFLLPTAGETFGVALAEALACGLPVVASGVGGHVAMLGGFEAARVVGRDARELADAMLAVLDGDDEDRRRATVDLARERFSEETRASAYAAVYAAAERAARGDYS